MKKIVYILFLLLFILYGSTRLKAEPPATWNVTSTTTNNVYGVEYTKAFGESTSANWVDKGNQMVNLFSIKTDGVSSKLVSWGMKTSPDKLTRIGLTYIADDYEKKHPGWIVVAGVNGDQYFQYFGNDLAASGSFYYVPQPYYPLIMEGERRFSSSPLGTKTHFIGIANNDSQNSFVYPSAIDGLYLEILNNNNEVVEKIKVDKINDVPSNSEIAVWMAYNGTTGNGNCIAQEVNSSSKIYIVEDADVAYMSNSRFYDIGSQEDTLFGKGVVSKIDTLATIDRWQFAIEGNGLEDKIKVDTKIRVQYYYTDQQLNEVESAFGYHSVQRKNNEDVSSTAPYNTNRYNRSIFGKKADGTYILMTIARGDVNNGTYTGTSHDESNKILEYYGVTEAYQQDGGGSVTAIVRNANGSFDVVNESSDSSTKQRNILSGCFFVVRDPGYVCYGKDSTRTSITLTKKSNINDDVMSNIYATLNNKTYYPQENGNIIIDGLQDNTSYGVELHYSFNGKENVITLTGKTDEIQFPRSGIIIKNNYPNYLEVEYTDKYYKNYLATYVSLYKKNELIKDEVQLEKYGDTHIFDGLSKATSYTLKVRFKIYDDLLSREAETVEDIDIITDNVNIPVLTSFELNNIDNKSVKVLLNISDVDEQMIGGFINYRHVGSETYDQYYIDSSDKEITIDKLDFSAGDYEFFVEITYGDFKKMEYDIHKVEKKKEESSQETPNNENNENTTPTKTKKCGKKSGLIFSLLTSISLLFIVIKKKH